MREWVQHFNTSLKRPANSNAWFVQPLLIFREVKNTHDTKQRIKKLNHTMKVIKNTSDGTQPFQTTENRETNCNCRRSTYSRKLNFKNCDKATVRNEAPQTQNLSPRRSPTRHLQIQILVTVDEMAWSLSSHSSSKSYEQPQESRSNLG